MKDDLYYSELLERYLQDNCSPKEASALFEYLQTKESDKMLLEKLRKEFLQAKSVERAKGDKVREQLLERVTAGKVVRLRSRRYGWRWVAAAVVLFLVFGLWFMVGRNRGEKPSVAVGPRVVQEVAPGGDKAILTLADGSQVVLDTASNGALSKQGNVTVIKLDGKLAYQSASSSATTAVTYNTITTPRGGQYQLELADGSKVWLNAASSLRFPAAFSGKERRVELTGEGYFEVAHNAEKPFHVMVNEMDVKVLGTHFNINAYSDEPEVKTTLLEGSVKVSDKGQSAIIKPGQQAVVTLSGAEGSNYKLQTINSVDLEATVAWKNGYFSFHNADIQTVMRQLARWYNVTVEYKGAVPERVFEGEMQRDLVLSQALKLLETNLVNFKIEGKKIIVMP